MEITERDGLIESLCKGKRAKEPAVIDVRVSGPCLSCGDHVNYEVAMKVKGRPDAELTGRVLVGRALWRAQNLICDKCILNLIDTHNPH